MTVYINSLSTSVPPHELPQNLVQVRAEAILGPRYPQFERLLKTFTNAGIDRRFSVVPLEWFEETHGWKDRNDTFVKGATTLFEEVATRALDEAGWRADEVDSIVTVSSTGIATPTLEARAADAMGFRHDVLRVPVFGLGCAGGVSGLSIAQTLAAGRPGSKVLLVVIEACTLSFRSDRMQKADIIATVLFGDGAAAACLSSEAGSRSRVVTLDAGWQTTWPDTLGIMGWDVDDTGLGVVFDRSIPEFVNDNMAKAVDDALSASKMKLEDVDRFVCHPGGKKVIEALEGALHLPQGELNAERDVLREHGNMSAPTVMFVMRKLLDEGRAGRMMACALGPGFTGSFLPYTVQDAA